MKKYSFVIVFCFFLFENFKAQQLVFKNLSIESGIPANEVYHLAQDNKGYVYVFSEYGIVKHNGSKFISVCTNIPTNQCAAYWVATFGDKLYFVNSKNNVYQIENDKALLISGIEHITAELNNKNQLVTDMFFDQVGNLYLSTFTETTTVPFTKYKVKGASVLANATVVNKALHLTKATNPNSGKNFLKVVDQSGNLVKKLSENGVDIERSAVIQVHNGMYIGRDKTITYYQNGKDSICHALESSMISMKRAQNGHIWVGLAYGGLLELDENLNVVRRYFGNLTVSDLLFDDQSGFWVSTIEKGVFYSKNVHHVSYSNVAELTESISLLKLIDQKLFVGTVTGNLFTIENEQLTKIDLGGNTSYITDIILFDGKYYVGTKHSILQLSLDLKQVSLSKKLRNSYSFAATPDELILLSNSTIYVKKKGVDSSTIFTAQHQPRSILERFTNEFFVGTNKGLFCFSSKLFCPLYLKPLLGQNISKIKIDAAKNIWICTKGAGLYCLSAQNKLNKISYLPSTIINDVVFSVDNKVFLATNNGAFVLDRIDLRSNKKWKLVLDEETVGICLFGQDVYFATKTGLTKVHVSKLFQTTNCRFHLESVLIKGKKMPLKYFSARYNENSIYFNFDVLKYDFDEKKLHFTLEGNSSLKGLVVGTQIHLQNLAPGFYTLIISPEEIGVNEIQNIRFSFYISPAFWQTAWFKILATIVLILGVILICWFVFHRIKTRNERKLILEKTMTEYRLTALKAQINPHFMSNSLVSIQQLILSDQTDKANSYIAKFSYLIRHLLNYSDQSVNSLASEIKMIELYVELEQLRFSDKFIFELIIDEKVDLNELYIPAMITQPLIENAIWHGLLPLPKDTSPVLSFSIQIDDTELTLIIKDNGTSRFSSPEIANEQRQSKGTGLIQNRLESLNQLYEMSGAAISFEEVFEGQETKVGTIVKVIFSKQILAKLYP
jgi:ligand-binding sensor domain-containing protein/two-component sensor histidine kinase